MANAQTENCDFYLNVLVSVETTVEEKFSSVESSSKPN